jgi:hypothetical protein
MSASILRFALTNEQVTESLPVGGVKLDVNPFERERFAEPQSCFEKQYGHVSERLGRSFQVKSFLLMCQNEIPAPLTVEQFDPGHSGDLVPIVREVEDPSQSCQLAVNGGHGNITVATLDITCNESLVDLVQRR